jgi:hypothetical protein
MYVQNIISPSGKRLITLGHIDLELYLHRSVFPYCTKDLSWPVSRVRKSFARLPEWNFVMLKDRAVSFRLNIKRELRRVDLMMYSRREHFVLICSPAYHSVARNSLAQAAALLTCIRKVSGSNLGRDSHYHHWGFPWVSSFSASKWDRYPFRFTERDHPFIQFDVK